jgi:hypothetical protein
VLETDNSTPYFLNLHTRDVAHTLILGMTGSGKSYFCNFLLQNAQKYEPLTFIFDIGGSFKSLTTIFEGSYLNVGQEARDFTINPFSLPQTKENLQFLFSFFRVLIEGNAASSADGPEARSSRRVKWSGAPGLPMTQKPSRNWCHQTLSSSARGRINGRPRPKCFNQPLTSKRKVESLFDWSSRGPRFSASGMS